MLFQSYILSVLNSKKTINWHFFNKNKVPRLRIVLIFYLSSNRRDYQLENSDSYPGNTGLRVQLTSGNRCESRVQYFADMRLTDWLEIRTWKLWLTGRPAKHEKNIPRMLPWTINYIVVSPFCRKNRFIERLQKGKADHGAKCLIRDPQVKISQGC